MKKRIITEEEHIKRSEAAKRMWKQGLLEKRKAKVNESLIIQCYQSGDSQVKVAKIVGTTPRIVRNVLKRNGIKCRPFGGPTLNQWGPMNSSWRGEAAGLVNKHRRIYRRYGQPSECDVCGVTDPIKTYDWANLTGNYDDPSDFKRMCRSCHKRFDIKKRKLALPL